MVSPFSRAGVCRFLIYVWILVLVLAILPWTANPVKPVKDLVTATAALLVTLAGLGMLSKAAKKEGKTLPLPLLLLGLSFVWSCAAALTAKHGWLALDALRQIFPLLLLAWYTFLLFREEGHRKQLVFVICLALCISSLYGLFQYFGLDPFPWATREIEEYRGLPATFGNPNFAGHSLVLVIILAVGLIAASPRGPAWLLLPSPLFHLYQTQMRGAVLALCAAIFLTGLVLFFRKKIPGDTRKKIVLVFLSLLLAGLAGLSILLPLSKKLSGLYFPTGGSLILRYNGYYGATRMLLDHPVTGVGPGNYSAENIPYWTFYERRWFADENKRNTHVHCDPLESGVESGLPGLALHLFLFASLLVHALYLVFETHDPGKRRWALVSAAFFMAFFVDGLFGFNLRLPVSGALFYVMVGLFSALWMDSPQDDPKEESCAKRAAKSPVKKTDLLPQTKKQYAFYFLDAVVLLLALASAWWALQLFRGELLWHKGNSLLAWAEKNQNHPEAGRFLQKAESEAVQAFKKCRWDARYSNLLGHIALKRGEAQTAISCYRHSVQLDPDHPHTLANLARAWLNLAMQQVTAQTPDLDSAAKFLKEGESVARKSRLYCPESPYVQDVLWRILRAQAHLTEMKGDDASSLWLETRDLVDSHLRDVPLDIPAARRALLTACNRTDQMDGMELLLKTLALDPTSRDEFWDTALRWAKKSGREEACMDALFAALAIQRSLQDQDPSWFVSLLRRLTLIWTEQYASSCDLQFYIDHALFWFPESLELWILLAQTCPEDELKTVLRDKAKEMEGKKIPEFISLFTTSPESESKLAREASLLARAALENQSLAAMTEDAVFARALLKKMTTLPISAERQVEIHANVATVFLEGGHWAEADTCFALALEGMSGEGSARLKASRARALAQLNRLSEARQLSQEAVQLKPEDPMNLFIHGRILRQLQEDSEAEAVLKKALGLVPDKTMLHRQIGQELSLIRSQEASANDTQGGQAP